nr:hypothetical protein [Biomaibacter acetigenes]
MAQAQTPLNEPKTRMKTAKKSTQESRSLYYDAWLRLKRNKAAMVGLFFVILLVVVAIFAEVIAPHDPYAQNLEYRLKPPTAQHLLGTDDYGRDILSRIIYGARVSLMVGVYLGRHRPHHRSAAGSHSRLLWRKSRQHNYAAL